MACKRKNRGRFRLNAKRWGDKNLFKKFLNIFHRIWTVKLNQKDEVEGSNFSSMGMGHGWHFGTERSGRTLQWVKTQEKVWSWASLVHPTIMHGTKYLGSRLRDEITMLENQVRNRSVQSLCVKSLLMIAN